MNYPNQSNSRGTVPDTSHCGLAAVSKLCTVCLAVACVVSSWIVYYSGTVSKSAQNYEAFAMNTSQSSLLRPESTSLAMSDDATGRTNLIRTPKESNSRDTLARVHDIRSLEHLRKIESQDVTSPFEKLWPRYRLPRWARKDKNFDVAPERSICFVHVGKAGGSAVGCSLGFSLHCNGSKQRQGQLPKLTTSVFHKDVYNCHDNSAYFLFVVRDPIDRAQSAFNYERPSFSGDGDDDENVKELYVDCPFWTFEELIQNGVLSPEEVSDENKEGPSSETCHARAINSLHGTENHASHLYFNYQYYYEAVPQDAQILVIRNEHLVDDWNDLESFVGGKGKANRDVQSIPKSNSYPHSAEDLFLSESSRVALCHELCNEIQMYKSILERAVNLDKQQLQVSLDELKAKCPEEASAEICSDALPDISQKLAENRGYDTVHP
mmetsp:Transcript_29163/g.61926  ORF Transcript_29163/g.61926 Transcript_29163/m.61926 type:complete len:437 (+) Transcript_29163:337-1647(+)